MTDNTGAISTKPVRVDVKSVDRELSSMWRKAAEGDTPGVSAPLTRTLLSNLVVYATDEAEAEAAAQVVVELAANHPNRAIIVDAQPDGAERKLEAEISMFCSIGERGRRLCGEQVRLHAHGLRAEALGTIMPMLAPDLPVYLWTPGSLQGDGQVYRDLAQFADHWIIDSAAFADDQAFEVVDRAGRGSKPPVIIHDLSWVAAARWRELVARLFDPRPAREYLTGVTQVEIIHKPENTEAIMMAAWLISQLQWNDPQVRRVSASDLVITVKVDGRPLTLNLKASKAAKWAVDEVVITSSIDAGTGVFRAARSDNEEEAVTESQAPDIPDVRNIVSTPPVSLSSAVCQALDAPGADTLYGRAYPVARELTRLMRNAK